MILEKIEFSPEERQENLIRTWRCDGFTIYEHPTYCTIKIETHKIEQLWGNKREISFNVKKEASA